MILVISQEEDINTDKFMEWCYYYGKDVIRVNEEENSTILNEILFEDGKEKVSFNVRGRIFSLDDIESVWFRRGNVLHITNEQLMTYQESSANDNSKSIKNYFINEAKTIDEYIIHLLKEKKHLNDPLNYNSNKLIALNTAMNVGLAVPKTLITNNKKSLKWHYDKGIVITKSIQDAITIEHDKYRFAPYVHTLDLNIDNLPDEFYYSKFQHSIDAKYELRVFFINDQYYTHAQFKLKASGDGGVNKSTEIGAVPYLLPDSIKEKLMLLNEKLGYQSGSIDMLVDSNDMHYFLEINPVGQYEYMSVFCNYNLDFEIYKYLSHE